MQYIYSILGNPEEKWPEVTNLRFWSELWPLGNYQ